MRWVTNSPNPYEPGYLPVRLKHETMRDAVLRDRYLWDRTIKGRPQATDNTYTVEQLEEMGMYGLYEED